MLAVRPWVRAMLVVHVCSLRKAGLRCKEMQYARGDRDGEVGWIVVGPIIQRGFRASPMHQRVLLAFVHVRVRGHRMLRRECRAVSVGEASLKEEDRQQLHHHRRWAARGDACHGEGGRPEATRWA